MRFMLISDNHDTVVGLRLAGIEGVIASNKSEVENYLRSFSSNSDIGIILITELLCDMCPDLIDDMKLHNSRPLIATIPDRHCDGRRRNSIVKYVREAIGINI